MGDGVDGVEHGVADFDNDIFTHRHLDIAVHDREFRAANLAAVDKAVKGDFAVDAAVLQRGCDIWVRGDDLNLQIVAIVVQNFDVLRVRDGEKCQTD